MKITINLSKKLVEAIEKGQGGYDGRMIKQYVEWLVKYYWQEPS